MHETSPRNFHLLSSVSLPFKEQDETKCCFFFLSSYSILRSVKIISKVISTLWNNTFICNAVLTCRLYLFQIIKNKNSPSYTLASVISLTAAASTMLRITNFLMALSLGTHLAQFVQRTGLTWPRPFLLRPLLRRFWVWSQRFKQNFCKDVK